MFVLFYCFSRNDNYLLIFFFFQIILNMVTTTKSIRDKRSQNPRKVFSPSTASVPLPTHYLIYMDDTVSYSIVGRTSIKKVQGKMATLIINKKKLIGEIVVSGKYKVSNLLYNFLSLIKVLSPVVKQNCIRFKKSLNQSIKVNVIFNLFC